MLTKNMVVDGAMYRRKKESWFSVITTGVVAFLVAYIFFLSIIAVFGENLT